MRVWRLCWSKLLQRRIAISTSLVSIEESGSAEYTGHYGRRH